MARALSLPRPDSSGRPASRSSTPASFETTHPLANALTQPRAGTVHNVPNPCIRGHAQPQSWTLRTPPLNGNPRSKPAKPRPSWRGLSACRVPTHRDARPPGPRLLPLSKPTTRRPTRSPNPARGLSTTSTIRSSAGTPNRSRGHCGLLPPTETLDPKPPNPESKQGRGAERRAAKPPLQPLRSPPASSLAHPDCSRIPLPHRPSVSRPHTLTRAAQPVRLMFIDVHRGAS